MKKMFCEVCESSNFAKVDGMFVCQDCGMKYDLAEAKGLMREVEDAAPAAPAKAAPAPKDAAMIQSWLELSENSFNESNNEKAEEYANKVLDVDGDNALAWLLKGEAIGWQSTVSNIRFIEMITCWQFALKNVSAEMRDKYKEIMKDQATRLNRALLSVNAENFGKNPSDDNLKRLKNCVSTILDTQKKLIELGLFMDLDAVVQYGCEQMNTAGVTGSDKADEDFGPERRNKYKAAWERWMNETDRCIELLHYALHFCKKESTANQIFKNLKTLEENVISSCSYKFDSNPYSYDNYVVDYTLTDSAKAVRRKRIESYRKTLNETLAKIREKQEEENRKKQEEQRKRNESYWAAHAEEKKKLDDELNDLEGKKKALADQIRPMEARRAAIKKESDEVVAQRDKPVPAQVEKQKIMAQVAQLQSQCNSLNIFQGKQKKQLMMEIAEKTNEAETFDPQIRQQVDVRIKEAQAKLIPLNEESKDLADKIAELKKQSESYDNRIKAIKAELAKNH